MHFVLQVNEDTQSGRQNKKEGTSFFSMNLYEILGLSSNASYEEIKAAYFAAVLRFHPDKLNGNDDFEKFTQVQNAWETLRDESLRQEYNKELRSKSQVMEIPRHTIKVELSDTICDNDGVYFVCRCSDRIKFHRSGFDMLGSIACCNSCSTYFEIVEDSSDTG